MHYPDIQFTFKLEKNKQVTFLDALAQRIAADQIEHAFIEKRQALICILIGMHKHYFNGSWNTEKSSQTS